MGISDMKVCVLRRLFLLQARWGSYEHPASPKPSKQRFVDLKNEFLLSGPVFNSRVTELSRSLVWTLDRLSGERGVLEACQFALSQVKESISSGIRPYDYSNFKKHYEHSMFQHIAARVRFLGSVDENSAFMNPAVKGLFESFNYDRGERDKKREDETPFKVNRRLRTDNKRIEYLKSVKDFLDDFIKTLDEYDYDDEHCFLTAHQIYCRIFDVLDPITEELKRLSQAEVIEISGVQNGNKPEGL